MKKISMDEDYIKYFCAGVGETLTSLKAINEELLDSDADVLDRYINFMKLHCLNKAIEISTSLSRDCLGAGHDINHKFLQTKSAKKFGWDKLQMKCPILKHEEDDE